MKRADLVSVVIESMSSEGEGIGRVNGCVLFVPGALPQEKVLARIVCQKKHYARADLIQCLTPSPYRIPAPCPVAEKCGGCSLMHLSYEQQLQKKTEKVQHALQRLAKLQITVPLCLPSPHELGYRNKIQLPIFQGKAGLALGLYAKRSHEGIPIDQCLIHNPLGDLTFQKVKDMILRSNLPLYDPKQKTGVWRHLLIKTAICRKEVLVAFVTGPTPAEFLRPFAEEVRRVCKEVRGVLQNSNAEDGNAILGRNWRTLAGDPFIEEELGGLLFAISGPSFFQVNPLQAEAVYQWALQAAELLPTDTVVDAYCGIGTLSLFASQRARTVIGIECVAEAIEDAKKNALRNGKKNVRFLCGTVEQQIPSLPSCDVVFLNPPRKGCEESVLHALGSHPPKKIVYISCDPATLARDAAILANKNFLLTKVQPFDLFPQTPHVETVALFQYRPLIKRGF